MNLEVFDIIIFITGGVLGLIIGLTVKKGQPSSTNATTSTPQSTEAMQFDTERKQAIIDDFFTDATEKLISTEKAIAELKQQISVGASTLATSQIINKTQSATVEEGNKGEVATPAEPPKDYSTNASGTLSENFGLQSKNEQDQDKSLQK
ncbi:ZapG family protein [Marinomonas sp. 2405UD68-3]|uniref:ZapG family protein n=1 Tax=Marinomonas sp. 2405UD68-3 TaxID=3391835 RepID=UPI0039C9DBF7